jgi:two-component system, cell cycle sensor histidine kinase and response regulator CckA
MVACMRTVHPQEGCMMEKRILVVDNHPLMVSFMANLLTEAGYQVMTAVDGLSALDILKSFTPDIIFIDLIMPNISGDKLCRIIRKVPELEGVYIIVLSAIAADEQIDFSAFGADACIAKGPMNHLATNVLRAVQQAHLSTTSRTQGLTYGLDIVHPREITKELLAVKRHFELILESMAEGILEVTATGRIVYANPVAVTLVGVTEETLLATAVEDIFEGNDRERVKDLLASQKSFNDSNPQNLPFTIRGRQVLLKFLPVSGDAPTFVIILNDITEQRRMEIQLQRAQKLEAVGKLAGGIAHDFNNILTAIMGNISLAKIYASPDDKAYPKLDAAEQAAFRAKGLTQQLLPFSKCGTPVKKNIDLKPILREICDTIYRDCNVSCDLEITDDLWPVEADGQQIRLVFKNLVSNAVRTNRSASEVMARASNILIDSNRFFPFQAGKYVTVSIHDQGEGLSEESISDIFDPYFTNGETQNGLELVTAYSIVKKHGGEIAVESEEGMGTIFHVYLPATEKKTNQAKTLVFKPAGLKGKVLVMDDEEIIREVVGALLKHLGYSVGYARDGLETLQAYQEAKAAGEPFDTILMDLTIVDGMGGRETIERLLQLDPGVKAIVSSGYSTDPIMSRFRDYGFVAALEKPYKLNELNAVLDDVLSEVAHEHSMAT